MSVNRNVTVPDGNSARRAGGGTGAQSRVLLRVAIAASSSWSADEGSSPTSSAR